MKLVCRLRKSRHGFVANIARSPWKDGSGRRLVASDVHGRPAGTEASGKATSACREASTSPRRRTKAAQRTDPDLLKALEALIEPATRGDPESPLRWTCQSTAKLAAELVRQNHLVSDRTAARLWKVSW
ncbi:MAG: hypothetical protein IT427_05510 [Pirellulales bacterium]|nr:hypothetical protein [Pirellulales bacterium]